MNETCSHVWQVQTFKYVWDRPELGCPHIPLGPPGMWSVLVTQTLYFQSQGAHCYSQWETEVYKYGI